ncbi:nitrite reductase small subunit NirD [Curvibacter sp. RS43]|jgi:nitrite reductase (NADH) small subunit|uniref:Nitrite reductase small subunit NirD n=1 Tax=Curvibacter microcysteis TaxID=3026419 RepID=A0ABT5MA90_9BURK|nr:MULTISPECIES: nitrite reductase small subunit NirD [unclassified Curvibacter]MDD0811594.1 nitrite reductase small subunit NirD [Curvibacter sp. RS43]MDD0813310.1 nitrite reductase small subunit NirD [Curvibacter sp. HBC28]
MSTPTDTLNWTAVCTVADILPNTGVCARVAQHHVAIFRVGDAQFFAIDNVDPKSQASVNSRGLVGNLADRTVVASPLYKHHFDLRNGECLEAPEYSVRAYPVRLDGDQVCVAAP